MNTGSKLFKMIAARVPRLRGFSSRFFFGHPFLDAWFAWFPLNQIQYDGAAVGEVFRVASRIDERRSSSWITEWAREGDRVSTYAEGILKEDHPYSAARTFLRAYTYYRTAHLATDPGFYEREMNDTYDRLSYCFARFRELSGLPIEKIQVPLEPADKSGQQHMHGYFLKSLRNNMESAPTLVWLNGAESLVEDVYWWCGAEGMNRGFNVFSVDAPGDTATRIYNPELLIEGAGDRALLAQVDYILRHPEVDPKKAFAYGISMGGYKASRLAQIDDRMQGIVANAPMLDAAKVLDSVRNVYKAPRDARGWGNRMCWQYGVDFSQNLKTALQKLVDDVWGKFVVDPTKISVPFLTMAGENELGKEGIRQAHEFHQKIQSPNSEKRITTVVEGAGAHCQLDNFPLARQIVFDWLENLLKRN
jgi:hypothetical protein